MAKTRRGCSYSLSGGASGRIALWNDVCNHETCEPPGEGGGGRGEQPVTLLST